MIVDTINQKIAEALKARDDIRLSTLRMLSSALNYEFIDKQHKLNDEEELVVVRKEAKKRREAIEAYKKAGVNDRAEKEEKELSILKEYLPADISDEELEKIVDQVIKETGAQTVTDMGKVMGGIMAKTKGRAEGGKVSGLVKSRLGS